MMDFDGSSILCEMGSVESTGSVDVAASDGESATLEWLEDQGLLDYVEANCE